MCSLCDLFLLYFLVIFALLSRISPVRYFSAGRFAPLPGADGEADRRRFPARRRAEAVCRERRRRNPQEERKTGVTSGRWSGWRLAAIVEAKHSAGKHPEGVTFCPVMPNTVFPGRRAEDHIMLNIPHGRNAPEDIKYNVPSASRPIQLLLCKPLLPIAHAGITSARRRTLAPPSWSNRSGMINHKHGTPAPHGCTSD